MPPATPPCTPLLGADAYLPFPLACRYALHLITVASLIAHKRKAAAVDVEDISRAYTLFLDVKRSVQYLHEYQEQYMFNEVDGELEDDDEEEGEEGEGVEAGADAAAMDT